MCSFFKNKKVLKAVANGWVIPIELVNDLVFSSKMMGDGFAITNHDGMIYSPLEGVVDNIFPTLHAITIKSKSGELCLVHMGIDSVRLKGLPFSVKVKERQYIKTGAPLAEMDISILKKEEIDPVVIVVLPEIKKGKLLVKEQEVVLQEEIFKF